MVSKIRRWVSIIGVVSGVLLLGPNGIAAQGQEQPAALPALQVVVLVDESGSLNEDDVAKEKEAARTIAFSVLAKGSIVSVVGFGSSNGPGQSAVQVACPPTKLDGAQNRDSLGTCVGALHRRSKEEGDGTDHVAALQQALDFVGAEEPAKKVVFLLTDGKLDVSDSPAWGDTPQRRNAAAAGQIPGILSQLDAAGAQVWPLGFGDVDRAALHDFAKGKSCTPAAADPHEQVTPTSAELGAAVAEAFSSASCVKYSQLDTGTVPRGGTADLSVDIPAIASDAAILVYKRDPRVQVEYRAPNASQPAPAAGGSHFEFAGQTTETESLLINDPEPGRWTIHLSSADLPAQDVAATVAYQAAVKAILKVNPPQPAAGQTVEVNMQVWARNRAVTDPGTVQGLSFVTALSGSAGFTAQQVALADPDRDGTFAGQLKVPDGVSGDLTFTGQVSGLGIGGDTRVLSTKVQPGVAPIRAQILFDTNHAEIRPGETVSGTISVTNDSDQPAKLRLVVADPSPGSTITVTSETIEAKPGRTDKPFTLRFGDDSKLGSSAATLRLVDDANPGVPVAERLFAVQIVGEPSIWEKLLWLWITLTALVAIGLGYLLVKWRQRNEARKVRGLSLQLYKGGFPADDLEPRNPNGKVFGFVVDADGFTGLRLQHAGSGEPNAHEIRRAGARITLTLPGQQPMTVPPGEQRRIGPDLTVAVQDTRGLAVAAPASGPGPATNHSPFDAPAPTGPPAETPAFNGNPFETGNPFESPAGNRFESPASDPFATPPASSAKSDTSAGNPFDTNGSNDFPKEPAPPGGGTGGIDPYNPFR
jgi:uncharacterized repeat protein (TIGR01451 family)